MMLFIKIMLITALKAANTAQVVHADSFMGESICTFLLLNKCNNLKSEYIQEKFFILISLNIIYTLEIMPTEAKLRQSTGKDQEIIVHSLKPSGSGVLRCSPEKIGKLSTDITKGNRQAHSS